MFLFLASKRGISLGATLNSSDAVSDLFAFALCDQNADTCAQHARNSRFAKRLL